MDTFFNIFPNGIPEIDRRSGLKKKLAPVGGTTQKGDKEKGARTTNKI